MIFGSISYLNLLPFKIFLKKYIKSTQLKQIIEYKKSIPSKINRDFKRKKIDAAFISSIKSRGCRCTNLGIVANGAVYSVLVLPQSESYDIASETSNKLSKILNIKGKVIIGDKALSYYLKNSNSDFIDLSLEWKKKTNLPFVFARLCYNKNKKFLNKIEKKFKGKREKIPQYYLKKEALKKGISTKELKWYLQFINYKISYKEKKSLKLFLKMAKES